MKTRQVMYVPCNIEERSRNHSRRGKSISITYSECMFAALVILQVKRMRRIILSPVAGLDLPYFSTLSQKTARFSGKLTEHKMLVLIFSTSLV